jgi:propanediol dehydratase small subunit
MIGGEIHMSNDNSVIKQIRKAIFEQPLKIEIYDDEILFDLWEVEIPVVLIRDCGRVVFNYEYAPDHYGLPQDMLLEMINVMKIIEDNKEEILGW